MPSWQPLWVGYNTLPNGSAIVGRLSPKYMQRLETLLLHPDSKLRGFVVVDDQNRVAGFFNRKAFAAKEGKPARGYLKDIFVAEAWRGSNAAPMMIEALRQEAVNNRWQNVEWHCHNNNPKGIHFYQSLDGVTLASPAVPPSGWNTFSLGDMQTPIAKKVSSSTSDVPIAPVRSNRHPAKPVVPAIARAER
jgi:ribosomal protein S18 acetylase RimI-like enzyme